MLEKIIGLSIKHKFWVLAIVLLMAAAGLWAALHLKLDAVPDITNNQVQIITSSPALATQEVEQYVTYPIEQSIAKLPGVVEFRSISRFGLSVVTVVFEDDVDTYFARQLINEQLQYAKAEMPQGAGTPELAPLTTGLGEVFQYSVRAKAGSEHKYTAMELRTLQDWVIARNLYGTKGIAEVNSFGGFLKQYEIAINPEKLRAYNVSIVEIFDAIENNNANTGGAYIDRKPNAYFIRGIGTLKSLEDIANTAVRVSDNGTVLKIGDLCKVQFGNAIRYGAFSHNGQEAVGGMVLMLKGHNSYEVVNSIKARLAEIQKMLPQDVIIEPYLDRTNLIGRAINVVQTNLLEGALIVIFVLVLFLGKISAGLIVASAIPLSLLFALLMMYLFDISANLMSLGAIDFGLIVDGAVIIVEAIMHYIFIMKKQNSLSQKEMDGVVHKSASKMMNSAVFGQLIILIVYLPILSLSGVEGKMFRPMAQTVSFAIIGALLLSVTYIPVMCAWFLPRQASKKLTFADKMMLKLEAAYTPIIEGAIRLKYWIVGAAVSLLLVAGFIFTRMGGEFIPNLQEGDFVFDFILPQGASLSQSLETSMQGAKLIKEFSEVKMVIGKTGTSEIPMDVMPTEGTDMIVVLKDKSEWVTTKDYYELGEIMTKRLQTIPGVFVEQSQPIQMRFNDLMTGVAQDVAVKIFGENLDSLAHYADKVGAIIASIDGAGDPKIQRITGLPQISIEYNNLRMAQYGVNAATINKVVAMAFAGESAGVIFEDEKKFDIVVRFDKDYKQDIEDVKQLMIPTPNGRQVPLFELADIGFKSGPAEIGRQQGKRRVVIGFNLKGRDVQTVVEELQAKVAQNVKLPTGYYLEYGGTFENLQHATARLSIALPIALGLIFVLLYFAFHNVGQVLLIFTAIPMSAIGGIFALLMRDMPFSISAGVGFIALFGVAVLNGIVLISTFNELSKNGNMTNAQIIIEGTKSRLRPVLMTATVASLGFLPMAMSTGAGAEVQKPLATVVIGGLVSATLLTLIVLPLLYLIFTKHKNNGAIGMNKTLSMLVLCLGLSVALQAQNATPIAIDEAIKIGLENNLNIKAAKAAKAQTDLQGKMSFQLDKTSVFIEDEDRQAGLPDASILKIGITQTIDFPTTYIARKKYANANVKQGEIIYNTAQNDLKKDIRIKYYEMWFAQNKLALQNRLFDIYAKVKDIAEQRSKAGESTPLEYIAAKAQFERMQYEVAQTKVQFLMAQNNFALTLGGKKSYQAESDSMNKLSLENTATSVENFLPLVQAKQAATLAKVSRAVIRNEELPSFSARLFTQRWYVEDANYYSGFSVSVNLPLFTRSLKKSKLASLEIIEQEANYEAQKLNYETQLQNLNATIQQRKSQLEYYENIALKQSEEISAAATLAYENGAISYIEFAQYLTQVNAIGQDYLSVLLEYNKAIIDLYYFNNQ